MTEETKVIKQDNKVESKAAVYAQGNVFKSLLIMTLPVLVLMLTNTLYQLIDSAIAANMVSYGAPGATEGHMTGSVVTMICMPVMLIMMATISLTNMGFGTIFAQRLGQKDEEGAKKAISTMHLTNIIIVVTGMIISFLMVGPWLKLMGIDLDSIGSLEVVGGSMSLHTDAILAMVIYAVAIGFSSFQGIISRQIRSEGHIKAAAYLPLLSIPFNIIFDIIFMGPLNMGASGAALATLLSSFVTTAAVIGFTMMLSKKGETYFSFSVFKLGVDWKLFGIMVMIGLAPFTLQIGRAYNQILSMKLLQNVGSVGSLQLMSSVARPMMLIMMPVFAVIQTAGAMIGYNFGAKNHERVSGTVKSAFALVFLFAVPQYILIMAWPQSMFWLFGAKDFVGDTTQWVHITNGSNTVNMMISMSRSQAEVAYLSYMGLSIIASFPAIMIIYYLSTRKIGFAMLQTFISFFLVFTIVILSFYYTIGQHSESMMVPVFDIETGLVPALDPVTGEILTDADGNIIPFLTEIHANPDAHLFYCWYPVWIICSQLLSWPLFLYVRWRDNVIMTGGKKELDLTTPRPLPEIAQQPIEDNRPKPSWELEKEADKESNN